MSDENIPYDVIDKARTFFKQGSEDVPNLNSDMEAHELDTNDPHDATAASLGLENVDNFPVASTQDVEEGTSEILFTTSNQLNTGKVSFEVTAPTFPAVSPTVNIAPVDSAVEQEYDNLGFSARSATYIEGGSPFKHREYQVARVSGSFSSPEAQWTQTDDEPSMCPSSLPADTNLRWRCRDVLDDNTTSEWSTPTTFTTKVGDVGSVAILNPTEGEEIPLGSRVNWEDHAVANPGDVATFQHFELQFSTVSDFSSDMLLDTTTTDLEYLVPENWVTGTPIFMRVRPTWVEGFESPWSTVPFSLAVPTSWVMMLGGGSADLLNSVAVIGDDTYVVGYEDSDRIEIRQEGLLAKIDLGGSVVWAKAIAERESEEILGIGTMGSKLLIAIKSRGSSNEEHHTVVYDTLTDTIVSQRGTRTNNYDEEPKGVSDADGSGFYTFGREKHTSSLMNAVLRKWDTNGNPVWATSFESGGTYTTIMGAVPVADDVIVAGFHRNGSSEWFPYVSRLDGVDHSEIWFRHLIGSRSDLWYDIAYYDNHVYTAGYTETEHSTGNAKRGLIAKWDLSGNLIWEHSYGSLSDLHYEFRALYVDADGVFPVGRGKVFGSIYGAVVVKYDHAGNLVWDKALTGDAHSAFYGVSAIGENLKLAGWSSLTPPGAGGTDGLVVSLGKDGQVAPLPNSQTFTWEDLSTRGATSAVATMAVETASPMTQKNPNFYLDDADYTLGNITLSEWKSNF